jgi:hypothetical protein
VSKTNWFLMQTNPKRTPKRSPKPTFCAASKSKFASQWAGAKGGYTSSQFDISWQKSSEHALTAKWCTVSSRGRKPTVGHPMKRSSTLQGVVQTVRPFHGRMPLDTLPIRGFHPAPAGLLTGRLPLPEQSPGTHSDRDAPPAWPGT